MTDVPIPYLQPPAIIINEALDRIGAYRKIIGDISDGSDVAEAARRNYGQALRKLLRTAHWNFARRQAPLTLLGDATGNSAPPVITTVDQPWTYAYAWPIDGVAARWMPAGLPSTLPTNPPLTTGVSSLPQVPLIPARFLVSSSNLYPIEIGNVPWTQQPDLQRTFGVGPVNRTILLTDVCNAQFVYTRFEPVIENWDSSFREGLVAMMALILIPVAIDDPKERMAQRNAMIPIVKNTVDDARVANGNDAGYPQTTDHQPIWITARSSGWLGGAGAFGGLSGYTYFPWDASMSWSGNVF